MAHHSGKFLETSDEWAGLGCYCFLMRWHGWAFLAGQEWCLETRPAEIWIFQFNTFDVSDILATSCTTEGQIQLLHSLEGIVMGLFVGYWITHCVPCLWCFLVFIVCSIVPSIFGTISCVIFQIYIIINVHSVSGESTIWIRAIG